MNESIESKLQSIQPGYSILFAARNSDGNSSSVESWNNGTII